MYSIIIPIYNRPQEIDELLQSLTFQTFRNFEVLVIEDGSTQTCEHICEAYKNKLQLRYFNKPNEGQGFSRNFGFERAKGDYFLVFDSDCIIPPDYLKIVDAFLQKNALDAFGGPDAAHPSFSPLQKAISYSMTSPLTTGGIRGRKKHIGLFHPRSFNMGISREVWQKTNGYVITRMGEDLELSIRIHKAGFKIGLIPDAIVYHKRRTSISQFYKQLHFFGRARINIFRFYKSELKWVHLLPFAFTASLLIWILSAWLFSPLFYLGAIGYLTLTLLLFFDSFRIYKSFKISCLSVVAGFTQLIAYGIGFFSELLRYFKQPHPSGLRK